MTRLTFRTAGESHGPAVLALVEGVPAGLSLPITAIDHDLARRQQGYGRGRRMQIEQDRGEFLSGVRAGETLGSPIAILVRNKDWANWSAIMDPAARPEDETEVGRARQVTRVRPGHADLTGLLKYDRIDARDILERASARETVARVAVGAVARQLLAACEITVGSHLVQLGGIDAAPPTAWPDDLSATADASPVRCLDPEAEVRMVAAIDAAKSAGDTLGGVCEVVVTGLPIGLGSHVAWDRKLDGRLAQALCSIPAVKGVEMGLGFEAARRPGSAVHDAIVPDPGATPPRACPAQDQPGRRARRGDDDGGAPRPARGDEADLHPHAPARDGRYRDRRSRRGLGGAERCDGGAGDGGDRRGDDRARPRGRAPGEVRRRFAR